MSEPSRLGPKQSQLVSDRATKHHQQILATAREKARGSERVNFFPELFRLAAEAIETDVIEFCDRAETIFEEIEAFGQEPDLDTAWLHEITGEKDNFYFSTDSLVSDLPPLPGMTRGRKPKPPTEDEVIQAVKDAVEMAEAQDVLATAHVENPSVWIEKIAQALALKGGTASFGELRSATALSPGALFLGLLLGQEHWDMHQTEFYGKLEVRHRL